MCQICANLSGLIMHQKRSKMLGTQHQADTVVPAVLYLRQCYTICFMQIMMTNPRDLVSCTPSITTNKCTLLDMHSTVLLLPSSNSLKTSHGLFSCAEKQRLFDD